MAALLTKWMTERECQGTHSRNFCCFSLCTLGTTLPSLLPWLCNIVQLNFAPSWSSTSEAQPRCCSFKKDYGTDFFQFEKNRSKWVYFSWFLFHCVLPHPTKSRHHHCLKFCLHELFLNPFHSSRHLWFVCFSFLVEQLIHLLTKKFKSSVQATTKALLKHPFQTSNLGTSCWC